MLFFFFTAVITHFVPLSNAHSGVRLAPTLFSCYPFNMQTGRPFAYQSFIARHYTEANKGRK